MDEGPEQIIVKRAYIIPSEECTDNDYDILITRLHTVKFLVNNRGHTRRAALDQPGVAATTRMNKEKFGNINTSRKESDAADILSPKYTIAFEQHAPGNGTLLYTNFKLWDDHEDDTEAAAEPREAVKNIINSFWSQMANGIDKAINSHLHTRMNSIFNSKQMNKKLLDYIAAKHTSKLYKLLKSLKRFHGESSNIVGTEVQSFSLMDTERYWKLKFPKYNRDYSDASLIHFSEHRNFMITNLDIKDPRSIN
ncbi:hypothetical protein RclHR1_08730002 [Rhizophagus clarus]|uniref:Uncharacterized protein n=1 Tax=Rhizophagus clarus TaxID=94130 RepID=A0A2Z6S493_9GLOM|nr:hypothetical protein RclHR1_08730002 [Rhizophagus clarus]GET03975.1 hypothetical protein RCL_jg24304.t1 [Rhizophagus clarus]